MRTFRTLVLTLSLGLAATVAWAQNTPVGKWHTIDDETGEVKSLIAITETGVSLQAASSNCCARARTRRRPA